MDRVLFGTLASLHELRVRHTQFGHELLEQVLDDLLEVLSKQIVSETERLLTLWILVNSSLFSSSSSKTVQYSSMKDMTGVFHRGDLRKPMIISKNHS